MYHLNMYKASGRWRVPGFWKASTDAFGNNGRYNDKNENTYYYYYY